MAEGFYDSKISSFSILNFQDRSQIAKLIQDKTTDAIGQES